MNALLQARPGRTMRAAFFAALVAASLLLVSLGFGGAVANAVAPSSGHTEIDAAPGGLAGGNNNPMQGCGISVEFYGYTAGDHAAVVTITTAAPSTGPTNFPASSFSFTGTGGTANTLDDAVTYYVDTTAMTVAPQGFHVTVEAVVDSATVKTKTIYLQGCPVTAVAPTVTQSVCSGGVATTPSYVVPSTAGVSYSPTSGSYEAMPGDVVVVTATALAGYTLVGASSFTLTFTDPGSCSSGLTTVTPDAPQVTESSCAAVMATYQVIAKTGVTYVPGPGTYSLAAGSSFTVTASPATGYTFGGTSPSSWSYSHTFDATPTGCTTTPEATSVAPTLVQSTCADGSATAPGYTVPSTSNVVYTPASGTYASTAGASVTVLAAPAAGYQLVGPSSFSWTFNAAPTNCAAVTPPVDNPPVDNPPVDNPPVDNPPVDTPPVVTNPAPVVAPPAVTPPVTTPVGGVTTGEANAPTPRKAPTATEVSGTTPGQAAGATALPFTGSYTDTLVKTGLLLLLFGFVLALAGRRRRDA